MSASLVGSEMCIRDRILALRQPPSRPGRRCVLCRPRLARPVCGGPWAPGRRLHLLAPARTSA
eukprot:14851750-Alexandrium_andersonii.AAC.1